MPIIGRMLAMGKIRNQWMPSILEENLSCFLEADAGALNQYADLEKRPTE